MSDAISLHLGTQTVLDRLNEIYRHVDDMSPAMSAIGEHLTESSKSRFDSSTAPDGTPWAPLKPGTVLARLESIRGAYGKSGALTKKGEAAKAGAKPLIDTGMLQDTIHWQLIDSGNGVEIGTNRFAGEWDGGAAVHQFGSKDGRIPARPFLGISSSDEVTILEILDRFVMTPLNK